MKKLSILFALLGVVALMGNAAAVTNHASLGIGTGHIVSHPQDTNPCPGSTLWQNDDGTFENGYAWQYGGCVAPYYGAFAEGYNAAGNCCGVEAMFSTLTGYYHNQALDGYVWDSNGTNPNNVLSVTVGMHISAPGTWPNITAHDLDTIDAAVNGDFFVGFWGNWPGVAPGWFIAADLDGFGGVPRTNIAPGIGYPTGWGDPSAVWGPTQAMGLRAFVSTGPVPVKNETWGAIKHLYNN